MSKLVIVESPAKAITINRYLGSGYTVKSSMGHIRDLPKKRMGVDLDHDFEPEYRIIPERKKTVAELQEAAEKSEAVLLAADHDREGEAICWHLASVLEEHNGNISRVIFNEITQKAIEEAFRSLIVLDQDKIRAQQTRRILDRIVGYTISPLLWDKIGSRLSAGRVQSIALRLICEREKEIRDFKPEEYWTITAHLRASHPPPFTAGLVKVDGKKAKIEKGDQAEAIAAELRTLPFVLQSIDVKEKKKNPPPPYITSSLQQDAFRALRFPVRKTMFVAQKLYEGLEVGDRGLVGLITYMRTDSVRVSDQAVDQARRYVEGRFDQDYLPRSPRMYKNKKKAQDAHEAIRPTHIDLSPEKVKPFLKKEEFDLYSMIWNRFVASQMSAALIEETEFDIRASRYQFKAKGEVVKFDGYLALHPKSKEEDKLLPKAQAGEPLELLDLETKQNFTQPPPRYTEGSLVKELEARGIGRPSTYAPIIGTLQDRDYVFKEKGRFFPTDLGMFVTDYLVKNFPDLMEFKFTAKLEEELDRISEGMLDWQAYLRTYYSLLKKDLEQAKGAESVKKKGIPLEETCPECGKPLVIKEGRYGRFKACSGYPDCKYGGSLQKKESKPLEEDCPECGSQLVERRGKYGMFVACSNYPDCKFVKKETQETGLSCPEGCGGRIIRRKTRRGKIFYGCSSFPKCKFATWDEPVEEECPRCGQRILFRKKAGKEEAVLYCRNESCDYKRRDAPEGEEEPKTEEAGGEGAEKQDG